MKQDRRGSWYLLTGTILGVAFGLFYSWMISPVKYVDAPPYALRVDYKDDYRALVAAAYLYSHDLVRAQDRLAQLKDDESAQSLAIEAQRAQAQGRPEEEIKALGILATALGHGVTPMVTNYTPSPDMGFKSPTSAFTPTPLLMDPNASITVTLAISPSPMNSTLTEVPHTIQVDLTATPTPTQGVPFVLQESKLVCNTEQLVPLIQVEIYDASGQPVPSVEMVVTWNGGEDRFYTGLQPELGLGYADFVMTPDLVYSLHVADGGQAVNDLAAAECVAEDGTRYWGSWRLSFAQP